MKVILTKAVDIRRAIREGKDVYVQWPMGMSPVKVKDARLREGELQIKHVGDPVFDEHIYYAITGRRTFKDGEIEVYYKITESIEKDN